MLMSAELEWQSVSKTAITTMACIHVPVILAMNLLMMDSIVQVYLNHKINIRNRKSNNNV